MDHVHAFLRTARPTLRSFNACVFTNSMETLDLMMKAHSSNAMLLAEWLEQQRKVKKVFYPGLHTHPQFDLAKQQQSAAGGVLSFEVNGSIKEAWKLIE